MSKSLEQYHTDLIVDKIHSLQKEIELCASLNEVAKKRANSQLQDVVEGLEFQVKNK